MLNHMPNLLELLMEISQQDAKMPIKLDGSAIIILWPLDLKIS